LGNGGEFTAATVITGALSQNGATIGSAAGGAGGSGDGTTGDGTTSPSGTNPSGNTNNTTTADEAAAAAPGNAARGATTPYWEYEAENANTTGTIMPQSRKFGDITNEASGRSAVQLSATGQYVQFTLEHPANAIVVRYVIPDAPGGGGMQATLGLYIGDKRTDLTLTSRYSWTYGDADAQNQGSESPGAGTAHHYFDEVHTMFDTVPAGTVIKLQKDAKDSAAFYVIDLVDFELVAAPLPQPAGSLSVLDFGATPDDGTDDGAAFQAAFDAGKTQKKVVYIPKGVFNMPAYDGKGNKTFKLNVAETSIQGAGMWYSVLTGFGAMFQLSPNTNNNKFADFAIFGDVTYRDDSMGWQGFDGPAGTGSSMTNVWIEHVTAGWWVGKSSFVGTVTAPLTDGLKVTGCRFRNTYADGINFANATANSTVSNCTFRNTGDDSMATWSFSADGPLPCKNNTFKFNTVQAPWRANCMAIYGGDTITFTDNICYDTSNYPGLLVSTTFSALPFSGTNTMARNTLVRAGGPHYNQEFGALRLFADSAAVSGIAISDTDIQSPTYSGLNFGGGQTMSGVTLDKVTIKDPGTQGIWVTSEAHGGATLSNVTITGATTGLKNDAPGFILTQGSGNTGF
jgi:hypothetical protein